MLGDATTFSSFAVDDLPAARRFYEDTLGLRVEEETAMGFLLLRLAGDRPTLVYPKPDHVPATYTVLNFSVDDIDRAVDDLSAKGVAMQRYDGFDQDERGIARGQGPPIAWFTDPAGNVLSLIEGAEL